VFRRLLIGGVDYLERAPTLFIEHYNRHRPHRSLELAPPNGQPTIGRGADTPVHGELPIPEQSLLSLSCAREIFQPRPRTPAAKRLNHPGAGSFRVKAKWSAEAISSARPSRNRSA
jgi:hypothetical protein